MIIQLCGLSGSGKSTIAEQSKLVLEKKGIAVEILDGDIYRKLLFPDLGYSKEDRNTNIRRLAFLASKLSLHHVVAVVCAINPYEGIRNEVKSAYPDVKTVFIDCSLEVLTQRDTKGLYKRARLPEGHPEKIPNLTGVNDPFEVPASPDLVLRTDLISREEAIEKFTDFIICNLPKHRRQKTAGTE